MDIFKFSYCYFRKYSFSIAVYVFLSVLIGGLSIYIPHLTSDFVDNLIHNKDVKNIYQFVLILFISSILNIIFEFICGRVYVQKQAQMANICIEHIIKHLQKTNILFDKETNSAYLSQRISTDANVIITFCLQILQGFITKTIVLTIIIYMLISMNVYSFLIVLIIIVMYMLGYFLLKESLFYRKREFLEKQNSYFQSLNQQLEDYKFIKTNEISEKNWNKFVSKFNDLFIKIKGFYIISYLFSILGDVIDIIFKVVIYIFMGIQIVQGNLSIGEFLLYISYFELILSCIDYYFSIGKDYQEAKASFSRIMELMNQMIIKNGNKRIDSVKTIEFKNVNFSYGNHTVIKNFSCILESGHIYFLKGKNGIGKSTLIDLLIGIYQPNDGEILFNGIEISQLNTKYLRKNNIAVCEQDPHIIDDSLMENINFIKDVCSKNSKLPYLWDLGSNFTNLNLKKDSMSGGEKQKIALVRTFSKNSEVIILDEPISALDRNAIMELKDFIVSNCMNKILIIISHNDDLVNICDREVYLNS
jgi:ABC-type bacteriocin/lantibiotic exporter with double-glycine peptidase domain